MKFWRFRFARNLTVEFCGVEILTSCSRRFASGALVLLVLAVAVPATADDVRSETPAVEDRAAEDADGGLIPDGGGEFVSRNQYFEIIAPDQLSGLFVSSLSEALMERFQRAFSLTGSFTPRVLVNLTGEADFAFPGPFHTVARGGAHVSVHILWGPETTRATTERALAQGLLTRLSFGYNREEAIHIPLWVELALQHACRVQTAASHRDWLVQRMRNEPSLALDVILKAERGEDTPSMLAENAFWLWSLLEREGRRSGELRGFVIRLLRGEDAVDALLHAYGGRFGDLDDARLWWLVGLNENLRRGGGPMRSAAETRSRIEELARFAVSVVEDSPGDEAARRDESAPADGEADDARETLLALEDLWPFRQSAALRAEATHRLRVLQFEIGGVHPYFHNAWLSLGTALEGLLARHEPQFIEGARLFRADLREGGDLMETVAGVLDDLAEELDRSY